MGVSGLLCGCGSDDSIALPFEGVFVYREGSAQATCQGLRATQEITGIEVQITRAEQGGLDYVAGPRCKIWLEIVGKTAKIAENAECGLAVSQTQAAGVFTQFILRAQDEVLYQEASGSAELIVPDAGSLPCEEFTITGTLARKATDAP